MELRRVASFLFRRPGRNAALLALLAGTLTPLGFAPFGLFPLALLGPAALFILWDGARPGRAASLGWLYGLGFFGVGVSWVYVSLQVHGNMPVPLAVTAVAIFVAGLALYPAMLGAVQTRFAALPAGWRFALVLPTLWVLFEWIRGWLLTGFPWLALGYSQTDTPLAGLAPWLGVYGVSFAVAVGAGLLAAAWRDRHRRWRLFLPLAALPWIVGWLAGQVSWVEAVGAPVRVALIQGNVPLAIKWRPEHRDAIVERYLALTERAPAADLYLWPEAAVPDYFDRVAPRLVPPLERLARERSADFLLGAVERDVQTSNYYNTVYAVGRAQGRYRKRHLVPFGEYLPLPGLFGWVLGYLDIPMSNFTPGDDAQAPIRAAGQLIGVSICYEDAFGAEIIRPLPQATLLVNVSEDSWFGDSLAPHQRLQMARMRTLETGRPMARVGNNGPSALIDHRGVVRARSPQFVPYTLVGTVQPTAGATPYVRYGNVPVVALLSLLLAGAGAWVVGVRATRSSMRY
jgi:apolipoprotein N-acyltransferase